MLYRGNFEVQAASGKARFHLSSASLAVALTVNLDTDRQQDNRYGPQSPIDRRVVAD